MNKNFSLIDVSVVVHQLYHRFSKTFNPKIKRETVIRFLENEIVHKFKPAIANGFSPVLINDCKDSEGVYWRQKFIERNYAEHAEAWEKQGNRDNETYKGNRADREHTELLDVLKTAAGNLNNLYDNLSFPGLEADDIAALVCKYKNSESRIDLVTVDRDWCGLVDDSRNVRWINLHHKNLYKIETEKETVNYLKKKLCKSVKHPSDCYRLKQEKGELGDQLPKNCRIELIDLINYAAPIEYGFQPAHDLVKNYLDKQT